MAQQNTFLGTEETPILAPTSDEKTMALLSHVLTLAPGVGFLAPLIIYLIKKDESAFITAHAKESLNFQITLYIIIFGLFITIVGIFLVWIVAILALVLVIIATLRANEGKLYKYPLNFRFIK
ncbi:MAG: DUF4870 domain-containing protein [Bacteroidota bacterium]|nr:DUF4870 domain-containing protein [Bacteroidota bacterium]